uniref:Uncharacterized protein n=1 Tax=Setaria italica TaxID=4555 RepID=K3XUK1_SETIT
MDWETKLSGPTEKGYVCPLLCFGPKVTWAQKFITFKLHQKFGKK